MAKAISLISGGLDSILATKLVIEEGLEVIGLTFKLPFLPSDNSLEITKEICKEFKIKLRIIDFCNSKKYYNIIEKPKFGYGKNFNPCIDCHLFMLKIAKKVMQEEGADVIVTGDVLGERPMSQRKKILYIMDEKAHLSGRVLRPLSAKCLDETKAEKDGIINREHMLAIQGRSRKEQFRLANTYKIKHYPTPGGGCLLTESQFCKKVEDLIAHKQFDFYNVKLLKAGRHFRLDKFTKLIVGRDKEDNELIEKLRSGASILLKTRDIPGPSAILNKEAAANLQNLAAGILAGYTKNKGPVSVSLLIPGAKIITIKATALKKADFRRFML